MQQRFLLQILLLAQHVSGTTMSIIRSSRALYSGCCLWYFVMWFSSCWSDVELRVMCPVCRTLLQHVEQAMRSAIKTSVASSWHFISTYPSCYCTKDVPFVLDSSFHTRSVQLISPSFSNTTFQYFQGISDLYS